MGERVRADCQATTCTNLAIPGGRYCSAHYRRLKIHGDLREEIPLGSREHLRRRPRPEPKPKAPPNVVCQARSCGRPTMGGRAYCVAHAKRLQVHGDLMEHVPVGKRGARLPPRPETPRATPPPPTRPTTPTEIPPSQLATRHTDRPYLLWMHWPPPST